MPNNLCQAYSWVYIIPEQVCMERRGKKAEKGNVLTPSNFLLSAAPEISFSWNYFLPQWYRACKACWDPLSIFRRPQSERREGVNPKIPKCIFPFTWSIAEALHLQKSSTITFLLLWPITKIIVSSTLSSWNEKRAKQNDAIINHQAETAKKGQDSDFIKGYVLCH